MTQHPWAAGRSGVHLASRRILLTACGEHPGRAWAAQQVRNLAWHPWPVPAVMRARHIHKSRYLNELIPGVGMKSPRRAAPE
jgi:hypothetical protein